MAGNTTQTHSYLWWSPDGISMVPVSVANPLPVTGGGGGGGGTSSTFGAAFPATGTAVGAIDSTGNMAGLNLDSSGNLKIAGTISATNPSVGTTGATAPTSATELGYINGSGNLTGVSSTNLLPVGVGGGSVGLLAGSALVGKFGIDQTTPGTTNAVSVTNFPGTQPVSGSVSVSNFPATQPVSGTVAATQSGTWTVQPGNTANTTAWKVDGSAVTQPVSGTVSATQSGTWNIGTVTSQTQWNGNTIDTNSGNKSAGTLRVTLATDQVQLTNALKVDGSAVTQPVSGTVTANPTSNTPVLKNGLSSTASSVVSSVAAVLNNYYVYNPNATVAYIQIFDVATAGGVTVGTTTPKWSIGIPATSAANLTNLNMTFASGIQVAATTTATGSTAPSTALDANFGYR